MRTPSGRRPFAAAVLAMAAAWLFAGCGGGSAPTATTGDIVRVSVASAPRSAAVLEPAVGGASPASPGGALSDVDHVWITVTGVALIRTGSPAGAGHGGSAGWEEAVADPDGRFEEGHVTAAVRPPVTIDLLDLSSGTAARLLNTFEEVPAGTYGKIRIYYTDAKFSVSGSADNTPLHRTAHGHLDIHFFGGDLSIPVPTDPAGGVRIHDVTINFVLGRDGLKITESGASGKFVMRPQVFATVGRVEYVVSGEVSEIGGTEGDFRVSTPGGAEFPVAFGPETDWYFRDGSRWIEAGAARGIAALRMGAAVDVLGVFETPPLLKAGSILISFPALAAGTVISGTALDGWRADNTFLVATGADNVPVYPQPDRAGALYEGGTDAQIVFGAAVTARGYARAGGGLDAFWITIGP